MRQRTPEVLVNVDVGILTCGKSAVKRDVGYWACGKPTVKVDVQMLACEKSPVKRDGLLLTGASHFGELELRR